MFARKLVVFLIVVYGLHRTIIGYGSLEQNTHGVHGSPLAPEDIQQLKQKWGFDPEAKFVVPDDVKAHYAAVTAAGASKEQKHNELFESYAKQFPAEAAEIKRRLAGDLPADWSSVLPTWSSGDKAEASRNSSGKVLNALAAKLPELIGGSADLTPSVKTQLKAPVQNIGDFQKGQYQNKYMRFGVREFGEDEP